MQELFHPNRDDIKLVSVLYALGDTTRLSIVRFLEENGEQPCNKFDVTVTKSTLSHHFKVLRESGIIKVRVGGTQRLLSIRYEDLNSRFPGLMDTILKIKQI